MVVREKRHTPIGWRHQWH